MTRRSAPNLAGNVLVSASHRPAVSMEVIERRGVEIASGKVSPVPGAVFLKRIKQIRKEIN